MLDMLSSFGLQDLALLPLFCHATVISRFKGAFVLQLILLSFAPAFHGCDPTDYSFSVSIHSPAVKGHNNTSFLTLCLVSSDRRLFEQGLSLCVCIVQRGPDLNWVH